MAPVIRRKKVHPFPLFAAYSSTISPFLEFALACGGRTKKMKYGHHGANHPVIDLESKRIFITSQNHGYVVDEDALPNCLVITHRSLFDQTIQGICHCENPAFGFQGHPEASPGPEEATKLFSKFLNLMTVHKKNKQPANTILYA